MQSYSANSPFDNELRAQLQALSGFAIPDARWRGLLPELLAALPANWTGVLSVEQGQQLMARVAVGKTGFFRNPELFDWFEQRCLRQPPTALQGRPLEVWCAGCATGEEAYSVALLTARYQGARVLASDLVAARVGFAERGLYPMRQLAAIPERLRSSLRLEESSFGFDESVRSQLEWRALNLVQDAWPERVFDLIFCRNVLIYLQKLELERIARGFYDKLKPGGLLILGDSEILPPTVHGFQVEFCEPLFVYRKGLT